MSAAIAPADATAGEPPRAEAGLDQEVQRNASVLLDGSQSFAPDGEIVEYVWYVTTPDGGTITPDCDSADCSLASFQAPELGEYEVLLAVEDDDGRRQTDTMYVTTVPRGGFGVELTGPNATAAEGNLTATVAPGDADVENITWYQGDRELSNRTLPENGGIFNRSTYVVPGTTYRAVVTNSWNQTVSDSWTAPGGGGTWTPSGPSGDYPRIEGPALVTGAPDSTDGGWRYSSTPYVVRTNDRGSVTESTWTVNGESAPGGYFDSDTRLRPPLSPGPNIVSANLEVTFSETVANADHDASNVSSQDYVQNVSEASVLQRRVLVDPAPNLNASVLSQGEEEIAIRYDVEDRYNPVESLEVSISGAQAGGTGPLDKDAEGILTVPVPDGSYGSESVTVSVVDGRGQRSRVSISAEFPEMTIGDVPEHIGDMPSDESAHFGNSPVFAY
ncbi:PKD domain-containing protein [Salinarchaeum sp. Harcht-Bsk1]|uniref:PKD domain-containing protein n=1 Tax=Salinarchaeum sp. Harcht-Bsk1 TaxID=1333523 RepID=UPI001181B05D|nr:PKD domain-containing protein [Salinarchaeum sp. Harcht-Bsk1]